MDAGIYFPLYLVLASADLKQYAIYYLSADLQPPELFKERNPLSPTARRAGWKGFNYDIQSVKDRFVLLKSSTDEKMATASTKDGRFDVPEQGLIATQELTLANVPDPGAGLEEIEHFCLTVDAYQNGQVSTDDLLAIAKRVDRRGLDKASLDELRTSAFIRQREYRWSTDQGQQNLPLADKIRRLVREIYSRLAISE